LVSADEMSVMDDMPTYRSRRTRSALAGLLMVLALGQLGSSSVAAGIAAAELAEARGLLKERKLPEAQAAYERLAAVDPKNLEVQVQLAELALRRDQPEVAVVHLENAARLDPKSARVQKRLGDAHGTVAVKASLLTKFGHAKKTLAAYERAVVLDPTYVDGRLALFEFYRQAPGMAGGGIDKAMTQAARIKELDPNRGRIAFATLYVGEKKYDQALAQFDEVLASHPDDYTAHFQIGRLAALTGQFSDRGLTSLRRCLELTPPSKSGAASHAAVHWRIGNILEKRGDKAGARAAYEASLALDANFAAAAESLRKLK
jgi:tetratricopeptide (TPR) repeat protein